MQKRGIFGLFGKKMGVNLCIFLSVAILVVCITFLGGKMAKVDNDLSSFNYTIVLDAGHGGADGGVSGSSTKVKESDLNLSMAKLVGERLKNCGFRVVYTRQDEGGLGDGLKWSKKADMQKRQEIIKEAKANLVLSLHMNKFPSPSRSGPQVFFGDSDDGKALAQKLQTVLNDFTGNKHSALKGDYFMLKCTTSPSVIVECGFLSNPDDEAKLCSESYRDQLAQVVVKGVMLYLSSGVMVDEVV